MHQKVQCNKNHSLAEHVVQYLHSECRPSSSTIVQVHVGARVGALGLEPLLNHWALRGDVTLWTPGPGSAPLVSPPGPQLIQTSAILAIPVIGRLFMWRYMALNCARARTVSIQASLRQLSGIVCNHCPSVGIFQGVHVPFRGGSGVLGTS